MDQLTSPEHMECHKSLSNKSMSALAIVVSFVPNIHMAMLLFCVIVLQIVSVYRT
jgi:hypothetical protein